MRLKSEQRQLSIAQLNLLDPINKDAQPSPGRVFLACKQLLNQLGLHLYRNFNVAIPIKPAAAQGVRDAKYFALQSENRARLISFVFRAKIFSNIHNDPPYKLTKLILSYICGGFEWSDLGKYSPNPVVNKVSEYHADGNRYRYMGPAFTHGLTMAVTVSRTPVSGLPSLLRGHSYQLGLKQFPVALSRSYGGDRSSCASYRFRLGSESHSTHSKLWSVIRASMQKGRLLLPSVAEPESFNKGRGHE